jgi:predicted RNA-binding protein with PIN domain
MEYLIDGYNFLHVTNVFTRDAGPGSVDRLHAALLDFLAQAMDPEQCQRTTVVFDAKGRRAVSRRTSQHAGMTIHYAARTEDADTLIAELVGDHHSPRNLTVVSSDHQVQRAAKRRRAKTVDSEVWYGELRRVLRDRASQVPPADTAALANPFPAEYLAEVAREVERESKKGRRNHK